MSTVFPRNKGKRGRSSSSTEANNSFVKTVTSSVSGLLPATISKWFSSPSSSSANGYTVPNETTDSSTDDEVGENIVMAQPPSKKIRFSSNAFTKFNNNFDSIDTGNQSFDITKANETSNTFSVIQSPPGKNTFRKETNFASTPIRVSEDTPTLADDRNEEEKNYYSPQLSVSQIGRSIDRKRKSLFYNDAQTSHDASISACIKSSCNTVKNTKQPSFKASLLGSPFYAGRTMYGGAASSLYMYQPNIKQTKVAVVQDSNNADNTMSHASRRVMDLLEHYSSPLIEAKRIPYYTKPKQNKSLSYISMDSSASERTNKQSYKTQELLVPSIASFLRVKQRSRLMESTTAARQIIASQSSTSEFTPYPARPKKDFDKDQNKLKTKVTSRLTRPRRGEASDANAEVVAPIELPTGVLQINKDNLPKFSFAATIVPNSATTVPKLGMSSDPRPSTSLSPSNKSITIPKVTVENINKDQKPVFDKNSYKFSSPIRISKDKYQLSSGWSNYIFGSPDRNVDKEKDNTVSSVVGDTEKNKLTASKSNDWKCDDCWVSNKSNVDNCVCCGGKKPSQENSQTKCSVCKTANSKPNAANCGDCEKSTANPVVSANFTISTSDKWKCEDCWVNNDANVEKCVCCGAKNSKTNTVAAKAPIGNTKATWRCEICWIENKTAEEKCAACGGEKPAAQPAAPKVFTSSPFKPAADSLLTNIIKTQSSKWECPSCLVTNENDKVKCICCETPKPGAPKEPQVKQFNFGVSNVSFKFGISPDSQTTAKSTENSTASNTLKKVEAEKNNNNLSSTPNFTIGVPATKSEGSSKSEVNFIFGQPSQPLEVKKSSEKLPDALKLNTQSSGSKDETDKLTEEKEPEQEVPKLNRTEQPGAVEASTPVIFEYFAPPSSARSKTESSDKNTASAIPPVSAFVPSENKALNNSLDKPADSDAQKNTFSFSSNAGTNNLFDSTCTSSSSATISFTPVKSVAPASITTTTLFPKNEPPKSTTQLGLTKSDTLSTSTTTAVFGFGSNSASHSETKPKFNFTFGSSKSDTPPMFNASFRREGDGSGFAMPAATPNVSLGTASTLANGSSTNAADNQTKNYLFGAVQKENVWPSTGLNNTSSNIFATNTTSPQKPTTFSFGQSTTFNSTSTNQLQTPSFANGPINSTLPSFGSSGASSPAIGSSQPAAPVPTFGSSTQGTSSLPPFGGNQQNSGVMPTFCSNPGNSLTSAFGQQAPSALSTFGTGLQNPITASPFGNNQNTIASPSFGSNQHSSTTPFGSATQVGTSSAPVFGSGLQAGVNSTATPVFGSNQATSNVFGMSNPSVNSQLPLFPNPGQSQGAAMFGAAQPAPAFGAPAAPSLMPAPAFSFGSPQTNAMFGFGQQQQQTGVYNFGAAPGASPQVQFNMGSSTGGSAGAQGVAARRMRKPVRRTTQR